MVFTINEKLVIESNFFDIELLGIYTNEDKAKAVLERLKKKYPEKHFTLEEMKRNHLYGIEL